VLEHLPNPLEHLQKCAELLAPGGKLLVRSLPNVALAGVPPRARQLGGARHAAPHPSLHAGFARGAPGEDGFRTIHVDFASPRHNPAALVASMFPRCTATASTSTRRGTERIPW
jgi:hypothetical protein